MAWIEEKAKWQRSQQGGTAVHLVSLGGESLVETAGGETQLTGEVMT